MGRPTTRTPELEEIVIEGLRNGKSLREICREGLPVPESSVRTWATDDPDGFGAQYARARDIGLDCRADAMIEQAKTAPDAALGRLAFDADRWYLSKLAPKRYGDKLAIAGDAENPLHVRNTTTIDVTTASTEFLRELAALAPPDPS